jgi:hypothetical protein
MAVHIGRRELLVTLGGARLRGRSRRVLNSQARLCVSDGWGRALTFRSKC